MCPCSYPSQFSCTFCKTSRSISSELRQNCSVDQVTLTMLDPVLSSGQFQAFLTHNINYPQGVCSLRGQMEHLPREAKGSELGRAGDCSASRGGAAHQTAGESRAARGVALKGRNVPGTGALSGAWKGEEHTGPGGK